MSLGISFMSSLDGARHLVEFVLALRVDLVRAGGEQHLRLEDEAVADDTDIRPVAEDLAQAAEEIGSVAREFLDALGQRDVQSPAEVGDLRLALLVLLLGRVECGFKCRDLPAERGYLLVEQFDLRKGPLANLFLVFEIGVQRRNLRVGRR